MLATKRRELYKWQESLTHRDADSPTDPLFRRRLKDAIRAERLSLERSFPLQWRRFGEMRSLITSGKPLKYFDHFQWFAFGFRSRKVNSISELARRFGYRWHYSTLYESFSALSHSRGIAQEITIEDKQLLVHSPYNVSWLPLLAKWSFGWQALTLTWLIKAYSPRSLPDLIAVHRKIEPLIEQIPDTIPDGF